MNEEKLLNNTLKILDDKGMYLAYDYLKSNLDGCNMTSQIYNYLYCLGALTNDKEGALSWLEEAVYDKNMWYRPEVFLDEDLDNIRCERRFLDCLDICQKRYAYEKKKAITECTYEVKYSDNLFMVLHGNQENMEIAKQKWEYLNYHYGQVEYLQSKDLDSKGIYRWDDTNQVKTTLDKIPWNSFKKRTLCGFSAGCNAIIESIINDGLECDNLILISPWVPCSLERMDEICECLRNKEVLIICGKEDKDCIDNALKLNSYLGNSVGVFMDGIAHEFPSNFNEIIDEYIK